MSARARWRVSTAIVVAALSCAACVSRARADERIAGELAIAPATALAVRSDLGWVSAATIDGVNAGLAVEGRWAPVPALSLGLSADARSSWLVDDAGVGAGRVGLGRVGVAIGTGAVLSRVQLGAQLGVDVAPALLGLQLLDAGATELVLRGALGLSWHDARYGLRATVDGGAGVDDGASAFLGARVDATRSVSAVVASLAGLELRGGLGVGVAFRGRLGVVLRARRSAWRVALVVGAGGAEPLTLGLELGVVLSDR
jgi:hypothetical protein